MRTRKRPPSHPGSILKLHYMEPSEISVTDLAKELKLSRKTVSEILNERGAVTTDVALQCESASNVKVKDLTPICLYNEEPKGSISKRAYQTDIEGQFTTEKSMLYQLQTTLEKLGKLKVGVEGYVIWSPKGGSWDSASKGLFYVHTENANQWHDFIIALANATNEGFQVKPLRNIADSMGNKDEKLKSLGLIKFILQYSNNEDNIPIIHGVLNDLQESRGKGKAHGSWVTPQGSLIENANKTLQDVIIAIEKLIEVFGSLKIPAKKCN